MSLFEKKQPYEEKKGIFASSIDYHVYHMSPAEKWIGRTLGFFLCYIAIYIFFSMVPLSILGGVAGIFAGERIFRNQLCKRRQQKLTVQFRDMLEAMSTSLGAGKNVPEGLADALTDMSNQYGEQSYIANELRMIIAGVNNNISVEQMLMDFAKRSGNEDIESFANVFEVCNRQGGNLKNIIYETKNVISQKIEIEMEIRTMISGARNELNVMSVMPFIIVLSTRSFTESGGFNMTSFVVKCAALAVFIIAYLIGLKIVDIKV